MTTSGSYRKLETAVNITFNPLINMAKKVHEEKTLVALIEEVAKRTSSEMIASLGWSPQRYYQQKKRVGLKSENFPAFRSASKLPRETFYTVVGKFLESNFK